MKIPGLAFARRGLWSITSSRLLPNRQRFAIQSKLGLDHVTEAHIGPNVTFVVPEDVVAGPGCYFNEGVFLDRGGVTLGSNVYMGPRSMIITAHHPIGGPELRAAAGEARPVHVGDGTWIGAGAIILPGLTIGSGCVIAAGAVVTRSCEPNGLYAGVPAKRLRDLSSASDD